MQSNRFQRRRALIQAGGTLAGATVLGVPMQAFAQAKGIRIGFVSPRTWVSTRSVGATRSQPREGTSTSGRASTGR